MRVYFSGLVWDKDNGIPSAFYPSGFADRFPIEVSSLNSAYQECKAYLKSNYGVEKVGRRSGYTLDGSQYPGSQG